MNIQETLQQKLGKEIAQASNEEIYGALLSMVQEMAGEKERTDSKKKLYYISAEFLIGKLLSNNMINLGIFNEVKDVLAQNGKNIAEIEEVEQNHHLVMVDLDDWQHVSLIQSQHLDLQETVSD